MNFFFIKNIKQRMLKIKNKHERDDNIIFIEEGHKYIINGDDSFISVTTYIHTHFKQFDSELIINKMKRSKNWKQSKYSRRGSNPLHLFKTRHTHWQ